MTAEKKRLIIIDSNSIIHRAYHALPPLTTKKGEVVNAVYGFLLVFLKAMRELQPDCVAACFDLPGGTFRHELSKEYKAKRPPTPEALSRQIPKIKEILTAFDAPIFEKQGFEADDLIGTISRLVSTPRQKYGGGPEIETIILSSDRDNLQLVNRHTKVFLLRKGVKDTVLCDENLVKEKYQGLEPRQLVDFMALRGDPSDNIPGVTGIGEKTAISLLLKFESLENLYKEIEENSEKAKGLKPKLKEILSKYKEQAFLSKTLAQIDKEVQIDFDLEKCRRKEYSKEKVVQILEELGFQSLIKRIP